ncbi:intron-binding protein aquarius-like [Lingula anatina]|uniref:Intron-binding protein aquarius-like n=1 Tax=Lingula anatina TaxID=7574 RepID=A0A1S3HH49_LINAN|nr:intron-binding protein aquarius-like [Lingula anatina]|eukprot:XP_013384354.1 intron-binding protein aquarius-like [Lingula anatina]
MIQFPVNHFAESRSKFVVNVEMDPHLQGGPGEKKAKGPAPTVEQIQSDIITQLANQYWSPQRGATRLPFNPKIIDDIYQKEILGTKFAMRRTMMLEFSQYLENYLWPNFTEDKASRAHILTICVMVNEKFRERVPAWEAFQKFPDKFGGFFSRVMATSLADDLTLREQTVLLVFLNHCFNSVEVDLIREQFQSIVSLTMWASILTGRRDEIFKKFPKMKKFWKVIQKKDAKLDAAALEKATNERCFLSRLIHKFYTILESIPETGDLSRDKVMYCERFLELLIGLESLLPTRRFFNVLLDDHHFIVRCMLAKLGKREEGKLFSQLLDMLKFYTDFQINDYTGEALTDLEMTNNHYNKFLDLQRAAFKYYPEDLRKFAVSNVGSVDTRETLLKHFGELSNLDLQKIASYLNLVEPPEENKGNAYNSEFLLEILVSRNMRRQSQLEALNDMPLYPTEEVIWDENVVPTAYFSGEGCLALPKLNLQFLTLHDYLLRNFHLFRLESTYEIRQDVEESVSKMQPWKAEDGTTLFNGWARMAQPIVSFSVVEVAKPNLGENHPARVRADITLHLSVRPEIKNEWENLRKHDVAFLVTVRPLHGYGKRYNHKEPFIPQVGLTYVRGCEIEGLLDADGKVIEEGPEPKPDLPGDTRTYRVWLDPNQYQTDMAETVEGKEDVYETFNIMMRRRPKENNFKAVLETIRDLMNTQCVVPDWLHDIILGYGDPGAAHYSKMPNFISSLDWNDTFLNYDHLVSCFPGWTLKPKVTDPAKLVPPFRLTFPSNSGKKKADEEEEVPENTILVEPHVIPNRGPYPYSQPKRNAIQFTPTQVEAIKAGMQPGLTMHTALAQERQRKVYDKWAHHHPYREGDKVWLLVMVSKTRHRKLALPWEGPYIVKKRFQNAEGMPGVTYRIQHEVTKKKMVVHHNRLKPYEAPRIPNPLQADSDYVTEEDESKIHVPRPNIFQEQLRLAPVLPAEGYIVHTSRNSFAAPEATACCEGEEHIPVEEKTEEATVDAGKDKGASQDSGEPLVTTRSGRVVRRPTKYRDFVAAIGDGY